MVMKAQQTRLTRLLPKTGQTTVYNPEDDGADQVGWWRGRTIADNKTRFIAKTLDGDDVIIDLATGLMWVADFESIGGNEGVAIHWSGALFTGCSLVFAGFSDWRIPNVLEFMSILNFEETTPALYPDLWRVDPTETYWTSTTYKSFITKAYCIMINIAAMTFTDKVNTNYMLCVRGGQ